MVNRCGIGFDIQRMCKNMVARCKKAFQACSFQQTKSERSLYNPICAQMIEQKRFHLSFILSLPFTILLDIKQL